MIIIDYTCRVSYGSLKTCRSSPALYGAVSMYPITAWRGEIDLLVCQLLVTWRVIYGSSSVYKVFSGLCQLSVDRTRNMLTSWPQASNDCCYLARFSRYTQGSL